MRMLEEMMVYDVYVRGSRVDRIRTYRCRFEALAALLACFRLTDTDLTPLQWDVSRLRTFPERTWSVQQAEFMKAVAEGIKVADIGRGVDVGVR